MSARRYHSPHGAQDALHCAQQPISHYLVPCVPCFLSLSLALFSLLYLPYPLCAPHLLPSLAPSALFPFPVCARCQQFAGHLLAPLFRGPPRPLPCALASLCPPLPPPVRARCRAVCKATPFPLFCPLPPCPLGPPGALVLSFPSADLPLPPSVRFPAKHCARHYAAPSAQHSPTSVGQPGLTVCGEGGRACSQSGGIQAVVTRVVTSEVARGGGIIEWVQPPAACRAIPGSSGEHGHRGRSELGNMGAWHTFLGEWVGDVGGPARNETLTSRDGLHVVVGHREHNQTAVLDLLHLQLTKSVTVVSQNQRVQGFTRVEQLQMHAQRTTLQRQASKAPIRAKKKEEEEKTGRPRQRGTTGRAPGWSSQRAPRPPSGRI